MGLSQCAAATSKEGRELACHGQAEFPVACYHDDLSRNPVPWHWHPELEALSSVKSGKIVQDHVDLVDAIRRKDPKSARELMVLHLNRYDLDPAALRAAYPQYFK